MEAAFLFAAIGFSDITAFRGAGAADDDDHGHRVSGGRQYRHYVDTAVARKVDLVSGKVPTTQLGTGTADSSVCLKGNSSWSALEPHTCR